MPFNNYQLTTAIFALCLVQFVDATIYVGDSFNVSYPTLPALYYGKSWSRITNDTGQGGLVTVQLLYLDYEWCSEMAHEEFWDPRNNPAWTFIRQRYDDDDDDETNSNNRKYASSKFDSPIALLVDDDEGTASIQAANRRCHLIDFERLALAWNVSYVVFMQNQGRPLTYADGRNYLDSPIKSETNTIGFQLVSHEDGKGKRKRSGTKAMSKDAALCSNYCFARIDSFHFRINRNAARFREQWHVDDRSPPRRKRRQHSYGTAF